MILVDGDPEVLQRVDEVRSVLEGELGLKIIVHDDATIASIKALPAKRPGDELRRGMKPQYPMCLLYTRCVVELAEFHATRTDIAG